MIGVFSLPNQLVPAFTFDFQTALLRGITSQFQMKNFTHAKREFRRSLILFQLTGPLQERLSLFRTTELIQ